MVEVTVSDGVVASTVPEVDVIDDTNPADRRPSRSTLLVMSCRVPATSVSHAMATNVTAASPTLRSGISVRKITSRGYIKSRIITISKDRLAIFCTHQPIKVTTASTVDNKGNQVNVTNSSPGVLSTIASKLPIPIFSSKGFLGITQGYRSGFLRYMDVADIDFVCTGVVTTRNCEQTRFNRLMGKNSEIDNERHQIVTIGHHGEQTLDVLVANDGERQELIECINQMRAAYEKVSFFVSHDALLLRYIWYDVDINKDGRISESEFQNILPRINFFVKDPSKSYREYCKNRSLKQGKGLILPDIIALLQTIKNTEGKGNVIEKVWKQYFGDKDIVDASEFLIKFVYEAQGEHTKSLIDVQDLFKMMNAIEIDHCEGEPDHIDVRQQLSRARFGVYLHHEINHAYDPRKLQHSIDIRLDQPMSSYFINTSHNTYLMGDQLQSSSSVEMYAKALRRGCKCLEIDCWDGEGKPSSGTTTSNLHPVVFHGHTLTSKILFADILRVVKNYLHDFPNTYPIILSLETHCSTPFQAVMAQLLLETFGSKLYVPPTPLPDRLPSPEMLRGMIVIKGKRPADPDDANLESNADDDFDPYEPTVSFNDDGTIQSSPKAKDHGDPSVVPVKPPKVCKELARLTLFHGTKWKSFEQSLTEPKSHMHSISESKIVKIFNKSNENGRLWRTYNENHMTRTYPAGSRVDSSNYNPLLAWSAGCQLVALNFQTNDTPLILNDGLFRQNSNCGYLLKPILSPPTGSQSELQLHIRVLSGSCLPKPYGAKSGETIDPFVQVIVHDVTTSVAGVSSYVSHLHTTNTVHENGFCPVWDEPGKEYTIHHPNIAMIQFIVKESDIALHDEIAYAAIPVNCIRSGYRSIQLYDRNNTRSGPFKFASLLVNISIEKQHQK